MLVLKLAVSETDAAAAQCYATATDRDHATATDHAFAFYDTVNRKVGDGCLAETRPGCGQSGCLACAFRLERLGAGGRVSRHNSHLRKGGSAFGGVTADVLVVHIEVQGERRPRLEFEVSGWLDVDEDGPQLVAGGPRLEDAGRCSGQCHSPGPQ